MERILEQSLLYDFYGELLTEHQRSLYEDFVLNDLSLGEIAEERGISRQGVYDTVRRCNRLLEGYEQKLHLIEKFERIKEKVRDIRAEAECILNETDADGPDTDKSDTDKSDKNKSDESGADSREARIRHAKEIGRLSGEIIDTF